MTQRHDFPDKRADKVHPPSACPACRSTELTTTSKTITSASYWRCLACGEIWNAGRLETRGGGWSRYR